MRNLKSNNNIITVSDDGKKVYTFDYLKLHKYWDYATEDDVEGMHSEVYDCEPNELHVILTTASGQGGIVAIIDIGNDKVIHIHDGSFAIKSFVVNKKVITLYHIIHWGTHPHYMIGSINKNTMKLIEDDKVLKLSENIEFDDENISVCIDGKVLNLDDGKTKYEMNIEEIL